MDCHDAGHCGLGWSGFFHQYPARQEPVLFLLGNLVQLGTCSPAHVHLDGRNSVPHQAVRADVRRPVALAVQSAGPIDAHHHFGLRHFWLGFGFVGRHLRHDCKGGPARTRKTRLRPQHRARLAGCRRRAGYFDSAVHHHGGVCRRGRRQCHPLISRRLFTRLFADGPVLGLHHLVESAQSRQSATA